MSTIGTLQPGTEGVDLVLTREIHHRPADVWSAIATSEGTARWVGPFAGDPAEGRIALTMTSEAEGDPSPIDILSCTPESGYVVRSAGDGPHWTTEFGLAPQGDGTLLTFWHRAVEPEQLEYIGPGWEFYLDRLVASLDGAEGPDFEAQLAAHQSAYAELGRSSSAE